MGDCLWIGVLDQRSDDIAPNPAPFREIYDCGDIYVGDGPIRQRHPTIRYHFDKHLEGWPALPLAYAFLVYVGSGPIFDWRLLRPLLRKRSLPEYLTYLRTFPKLA